MADDVDDDPVVKHPLLTLIGKPLLPPLLLLLLLIFLDFILFLLAF